LSSYRFSQNSAQNLAAIFCSSTSESNSIHITTNVLFVEQTRLSQFGEEFMSYYSYGELYFMNEEYDKAYKEFQASIDAKEGNENDSLNYLGCCLIALGKYHEAIKAFDKIIESAPTWERPLFNKGRAYLRNPS
jgi:tetratricopeptide (TPR) repeat protein